MIRYACRTLHFYRYENGRDKKAMHFIIKYLICTACDNDDNSFFFSIDVDAFVEKRKQEKYVDIMPMQCICIWIYLHFEKVWNVNNIKIWINKMEY